MRSFIPLLRLSSYYVIFGLLIAAVVTTFPWTLSWLPIGGSAGMGMDASEFISGQAVQVSWEPLNKAMALILSMIGVIVLMKPVTWVYMGARRRRDREQSFVLTLLLLPLAVAGIVIVVENSLALAFSLAGIVAGVRFRLTLDDTLDAIYIFMSIGVGLAAGIGALEIAAVISIFFNLIVILLWQTRYAESSSGNRWFAKTWLNPGDVSVEEGDNEKSQKRFDDNSGP
ncbi:MAG: DUF4956 domain-containing protein [Pseudomonadales bacterium]